MTARHGVPAKQTQGNLRAMKRDEDDEDLATGKILVLARVAARIDGFINESIGSMRSRAFAVAGAHILNGIHRGEMDIITPTGKALPAYASAQDLAADDEAVMDGLNAINRLLVIATWTALETLVDDLHAVIQPDAAFRRQTKTKVKKQLEARRDWQKGVTMFEAWFTEEGVPSALDPDHEHLLRHVARLRNALAHDGLRPSARYLNHAPTDWRLAELGQLLIPEPSIDAALEGIALYVAYLGSRLTGAPHELITEPPAVLLQRFLHPDSTPPRPSDREH